MIQKKERKKDVIQKLNERIALLEDDCVANRQAYLKMQKAYKSLKHDYTDLTDSYNTLFDMYHKELEKNKNKNRGYIADYKVVQSDYPGLTSDEVNILCSGYSNGLFSRNVITDIITDRRTARSHGDIYSQSCDL